MPLKENPNVARLNRMAKRILRGTKGISHERAKIVQLTEAKRALGQPHHFELSGLVGNRYRVVFLDERGKELSRKDLTIEEAKRLRKNVFEEKVAKDPQRIKEQLPLMRTAIRQATGKTYDRILSLSEIKKEDNVLEIGAGLGALTTEIRKRAENVIATDEVKGFVDALRSEGIDARLIPHEKLAGKIEKESQDKIISAFATELVIDPVKLFEDLRKLLKPNGILIIAESTPFHENLKNMIEKAGFHVETASVHKYSITPLAHSYVTIIKARKRVHYLGTTKEKR